MRNDLEGNVIYEPNEDRKKGEGKSERKGQAMELALEAFIRRYGWDKQD